MKKMTKNQAKWRLGVPATPPKGALPIDHRMANPVA